MLPPPTKFIWDENASDRFKSSLAIKDIKNQLEKICQSQYTGNYEGINTAVNDINNIFIKTAELATVKCKM